MNVLYRPSDTATTTVRAQAAFPGAMTATDWIEVRGFTHVEWHVTIANQQNVTDLKYRVEYCYTTSASAYQPSLSAEYMDTSGSPAVVKHVPYEVTVASLFPAKAGYAIAVPVHGRHMRLVFMGAPSVGTDQAAVTAYRRTT